MAAPIAGTPAAPRGDRVDALLGCLCGNRHKPMLFIGNPMFGAPFPLFHAQDGTIGMDRDGHLCRSETASILAAVAGWPALQVTAGWSIDRREHRQT